MFNEIFNKFLGGKKTEIRNPLYEQKPSPRPLLPQRQENTGTVPQLPMSQMQIPPRQLPQNAKEIAATIFGEAAGENDQGRQAVLNTIQNRANQKGTSMFDVVSKKRQYDAYNPENPLYQKAVGQFEGRNTMRDPRELEAFKHIIAMLQMKTPDITDGASHYYNPRTAAKYDWMDEGEETYKTPGHRFLKNVRY